MFKLKADDWDSMSSQFVMTYPIKRPKTSLPYAFTEHGVMMLANVLKSKKAREISILIVRAFITLKQYALTNKEISAKIALLESKYDKQFKDVYEALNYLLQKDSLDENQKKRKRIGY
jgi:phage regulator Rha-like protein